jgi:hypothetical protein
MVLETNIFETAFGVRIDRYDSFIGIVNFRTMGCSGRGALGVRSAGDDGDM